jgi:AcrR family transcriptional regulator
MADIIKASGLSAGAIYLQFDSKQQIAVACSQRVVGQRVQVLSDRLSRAPLPRPDEVIELVTTGISQQIGDPRIIFQLWGEALFEPEIAELIDTVFHQLLETLRGYLVAWARENRGAAGDEALRWAAEQAPVLLGAFQGHIVQASLRSDFDAAGYRSAFAALFDGDA